MSLPHPRTPDPRLLPFLEPPISPELYHYTDSHGFVGILTNHEIWATDSRYLNDSSEFELGLKVLQDENASAVKALDPQIAELWDEVFRYAKAAAPGTLLTASFSEVPDDLGQWRAYGRSSGYCLGFNTQSLVRTSPLVGFRLVKVLYKPHEHTALAEATSLAILEYASLVVANKITRIEFSRRSFLPILLAAAMMKHAKFAAECESRLIGLGPYQEDFEWHFRPGRGTLLPYGKVALDASMSGTKLVRTGHPPLRSVIIGPTPHPALAYGAAREFLSDRGLSVQLKNSEIPYRDW